MQSFRSHPSVLYQIRQFVRERAAEAELSDEATGDLLVAVSEACANSILHTSSARISLTWNVRDDCVDIEVRDEGVFQRRVVMPEIEGKGGHGIPLMMALVDEVAIRKGTPEDPGTVVTLVKCIVA